MDRFESEFQWFSPCFSVSEHLLEAMWCIWMAWDVCPCAGSFGESELHGVSMLGALGGQV